MSNLRQSALLEESGDVRQLDDKLLDLMKRLGIEAFPPHETLVIPASAHRYSWRRSRAAFAPPGQEHQAGGRAGKPFGCPAQRERAAR
jgi:hypothetical protein